VFTSQKGSLGEVSEFFEVMAQVDRDLTTVDYFDRLLGLIKNLGRHNRHPRPLAQTPPWVGSGGSGEKMGRVMGEREEA
jgi:hypothetical protein